MDGEAARLRDPLLPPDIEPGEVAAAEVEAQPPALAGLQRHLLERLELLDRARHRRLLVADVKLHHRATGAGAGVAESDPDRDLAVALERPLVDREIAHLEARIAEAEAEREHRRDALPVVVAVADEHALFVAHLPLRPG